ncbi:MAG: SRPBCC family protein [Pseudobacteriovorax sp.]|nr:SRPBCC family protein [Pseudobacteriovorax sp.]
MAGANREETFNVSAEKFYAALIDYENYPKILPEVDGIRVLEKSESSAKIEYSINLVKKLTYILNMKHSKPTRIEWELDSGSLFKVNSGSWDISVVDDDHCHVKYNLEIAVKMFAPKAITNKLVAVNLPRMMKTFYEHAKSI